MELIAHRGFWGTSVASNSLESFDAALRAGYGIETDIRDCNGELVISHDPPTSKSITAHQFFELYRQSGSRATLALNVKSDGLAANMRSLLDHYSVENYFCFDMSIPDQLNYHKYGLRTYARVSEYEPWTCLADRCDGVWLDSFLSDWYLNGTHLTDLLAMAGKICVVSPELHRRTHRQVWAALQGFAEMTPGKLSLCTDFPHAYGERKCA